ncbi:hypothetical protein LCGC14_0844720 [marine sediment metagenome]|uniref:Uncharacterized protein n=1 Tax=marine sediment metagenome TaxID=412755 RepID=A0A0F9SJ85_9ZZZZ
MPEIVPIHNKQRICRLNSVSDAQPDWDNQGIRSCVKVQRRDTGINPKCRYKVVC